MKKILGIILFLLALGMFIKKLYTYRMTVQKKYMTYVLWILYVVNVFVISILITYGLTRTPLDGSDYFISKNVLNTQIAPQDLPQWRGFPFTFYKPIVHPNICDGQTRCRAVPTIIVVPYWVNIIYWSTVLLVVTGEYFIIRQTSKKSARITHRNI